MKHFITTLLLLVALAVPVAADCTNPGQTQGPPGCDGGGNGLTGPNTPVGELAAPVVTVNDPVEVDLLPLAVETIRLALSIW